MPVRASGQALGLEDADDQVSGADLGFAEHQRAVDPAAFDRLLDVRREVGDRGGAAGQPVQRRGQGPGQPGRVDVELLDDAVQVRVLQLQDLVDPVHQLDVRVAPHLAEDGGGLDGLVARSD